jgi:hypothetical protein
MLSPRLGLILKHRMEKENGMVADSSFRGAAKKLLEPKFGWGHEAWVEELALEIEKMHFDPTWSSEQILRYVSNYVKSCGHESPSTVNHQRKDL